MNHLINIEQLSTEEILQISQRALDFEKGLRRANHPNGNIISMFFENSTRTRLSFEMAANRINAKFYDFRNDTSSINKGENLFDTINNLSAIGMNAVILRHSDNNLIKELSQKTYFNDISFVNAGSGTDAHPTQALLDFYTLKKHFGNLKGKIITIVGDITHSRVAKSDISLFKQFEMEIRILAPDYFTGEKIEGVEYFDKLSDAFDNTDIIMALRIQKERIEENIDTENYIKDYQITKDNMPYSVFLMHPGPVNWGVELNQNVAEIQNAKTILNQAKNGVFVRMAVLDILLSNQGL